MCQGDDGSFVTAANDQGLELRLKYRLGTTGGMTDLAEQATDIAVALTDAPGFSLARRFVVAGTDAHPGRQTIRAAEDRHVGADFHQQHGSSDAIDTGQGLQQGQCVLLARQSFEQPGIEAGDACFDFLDVPHQFIEDEARTVNELALQCVEQSFTTGPESPTGELEHLVERLTMRVADHYAEANAAIGQHLVQAVLVLLGRQLFYQLLSLPRNQAQLVQFRGRHE